MIRLLTIFAIALIASAAFAAEPGEEMNDPALEARARAISQDLRCLVCQNESIDTSEADVARDLRRAVRERLSAGDTDEQVKTYVVQRYGEFVLLRPKLDAGTAALWFGPFTLLFFGLVAAYFVVTRRRDLAVEAVLDPEEERRIKDLGGNSDQVPPV